MSILAQTGVFSWALQWGKYGDGTIVASKAKARIILSGIPSDGDTVVVGATTYTFKTALTPAADEVLIGVTADESAANLAAAINAGAGSGTVYGAGTVANASVDAVASFRTLFLTAKTAGKAGNAIALSETSTNISVVQFAGGVTAGTFDLTKLIWDRHRAVDIDYDVSQDTRVFPREVDGIITPTGAYKAGAFVGGGATIIPRLKDKMGDLLLALMGSCSTTADSPVVGANTHVFKFNPNDLSSIPWVSVRKHIPGRGNVRAKGVIGVDNMLASARLMIPQNDVVQSRIDFLGRVPKFDAYPEAWLYNNASEDPKYAALSTKGWFKLPTVFNYEMPVTNVVIEMINDITTPREEMVVGSYNMDDIVVRSRAMQIRFVHKWSDPDLFDLIYTGQVGSTDWSPQVFTTNYSAGNYAFEARIESPEFVAGTTPYSLTVRAGSVVWEPVGPVRLQGGNIIMQEYRGTVVEPDPALGVPYAEFCLTNAIAGYSIPVQP